MKLLEDKKRRDYLILEQKWTKSFVSALYFHKFNGESQMLELLNSGIGKQAWDADRSINGKIARRWACVYKDTKLLKHLVDVLGCKIGNVSVDDGDGWSD